MTLEIKVDLLHALENYLDMYSAPPHEVVLLESIANSLDEGATQLQIEMDPATSSYSITDNGNGMRKDAFEKYHTVALSTKQKGSGIGFAGVGAKIYLAAWEGASIETHTQNQEGRLASRMYRKEGRFVYDHIEPRLFDDGTRYVVKLTPKDFQALHQHAPKLVEYWYSWAIRKNVSIFINSKRAQPWNQNFKKKVNGSLTVEGRVIRYKFWVAETDLPVHRLNLEYVVFGKRVKADRPDWIHQVSPEYRNRIGGVIHCENIAEFLTSNKEDFKRNKITNKALAEVKKKFHEWLGKNDILLDIKESRAEKLVIENELQRAIEKLLKKEEYQWLIPWSIPLTAGSVPIPDVAGEHSAEYHDGMQKVKGVTIGGGLGGGVRIPGDEGGNGLSEGKGDVDVRMEKRRKRGISLAFGEAADDPREGWIDPENRVVFYNTGHPVHSKVAGSISPLSL